MGERERGTVVARINDAMGGVGRIRADNGESLVLFYWSVVKGFSQLTVGQRVEFSRMTLGGRLKAASLVMPIANDTEAT
jgi:cold shock CspA family protein